MKKFADMTRDERMLVLGAALNAAAGVLAAMGFDPANQVLAVVFGEDIQDAITVTTMAGGKGREDRDRLVQLLNRQLQLLDNCDPQRN